jgi:hypothetical protein
MRERARQYALSASWDTVFESVYVQYATLLAGNTNGAAR